jgi:hypothetical protein
MSKLTWIRLLLLGVILLAFGRVITHEFVDWDDGPLLYNNPNIVGHSVEGLARHWNPLNRDNSFMYNPMVFTLWWGLAHFSDVQDRDFLGTQLNPYIFHTANLAVHWLCACVVLEILRSLKIRDWPAALGAMVFAVHPLQTEAVAWASAMKDLLSGLFSLLCIWRYIEALENEGPARKRNYWASTLLFAAALLSKPSTVVLPLIVGAIDWIIYRRPLKKIAAWTFPWYLGAAAITLLAAKIQDFPNYVRPPLLLRPSIALDALAFYMAKIVWPLGLNFDYGRNPTAVLTDPALHHPLYWTWIFPVAAAILIWIAKQKQLTLAGLIFLFGVLPVLGLKSFVYQYYTTVADRYVYLSMLGVALLVAWWMQRHWSLATVAALCGIIVAFCSLSFVQAQRWTDTTSLYSASLSDLKPIHLVILGNYQDDLALPYLQKAAIAHGRGDFVEEKSYADPAVAYLNKAIEYYRRAVELDPTVAHAYDNMARDLVRLDEIPQAIAVVKQWMAHEDDVDPAAREKPGMLQGMLGSLYLKNRQFPEAAEALRRSLAEREDPDMRRLLNVAEEMIRRQREAATRATSRP